MFRPRIGTGNGKMLHKFGFVYFNTSAGGEQAYEYTEKVLK
jgi:hypothetical protein